MPASNTEIINGKADVYRLLSACYYQPEDAYLEEAVFLQLATALQHCTPDLVPLAEQLDEAARRDGVEALLLDYTRLFLGPFDIPAKPYGSIYLEGENVVMGDSTVNAKAYYRAADFEIADDFREVPDHVAVELEYLYLLSFRQSQGALDADTAEKDWSQLEQQFLAEHLGRWIEPFSEKMIEHAGTEFYRLLGKLTRAFILYQKG
jgi:TorA maturation chaperone TorD